MYWRTLHIGDFNALMGAHTLHYGNSHWLPHISNFACMYFKSASLVWWQCVYLYQWVLSKADGKPWIS